MHLLLWHEGHRDATPGFGGSNAVWDVLALVVPMQCGMSLPLVVPMQYGMCLVVLFDAVWDALAHRTPTDEACRRMDVKRPENALHVPVCEAQLMELLQQLGQAKVYATQLRWGHHRELHWEHTARTTNSAWLNLLMACHSLQCCKLRLLTAHHAVQVCVPLEALVERRKATSAMWAQQRKKTMQMAIATDIEVRAKAELCFTNVQRTQEDLDEHRQCERSLRSVRTSPGGPEIAMELYPQAVP